MVTLIIIYLFIGKNFFKASISGHINKLLRVLFLVFFFNSVYGTSHLLKVTLHFK